jgi:hypothetical protein
MTNPFNWDEEISQLRRRIEIQLRRAAQPIVEKEIQNILGRVRILISRDLRNPEMISWFIDPASKADSE